MLPSHKLLVVLAPKLHSSAQVLAFTFGWIAHLIGENGLASMLSRELK